jgi:hypothetical protein
MTLLEGWASSKITPMHGAETPINYITNKKYTHNKTIAGQNSF